MTIEELISTLECHIDCADMPLSADDAKEIIEQLKEFGELKKILDTCYLRVVKAYIMLRLGEIRNEDER